MESDTLALLVDWVRSRHYGKYRGTVADNQDATNRGRLKVTVPAVLDTLEVWAMPCIPYAGKGVGFLALPPTGSGVWVEFEGGDPSFPIWTGCFWADGEAPENANPAIKIWKTDSLQVRLDDDNDEALIENGSQARVQLAADVVAEAGQAKHSVGSAGVVSTQGVGKVEVTSASVSLNNGALEVT